MTMQHTAVWPWQEVNHREETLSRVVWPGGLAGWSGRVVWPGVSATAGGCKADHRDEPSRVTWLDANASLNPQALRSMNRSTHERSFQDERCRANGPESRTFLRTERSESPSGSPGTREPHRRLRQKGECRRERSQSWP